MMAWHKAQASNTGGCVEVDIRPDAVLVRDSKNPDEASLAFHYEEWAAFLNGVKNGEFDLPA